MVAWRVRFLSAGLALMLGLPLSAAAQGAGAPAAVAEDGQVLRQDMNDPALYLQLIEGLQQRRMHYAALAHLDAFDQKWPDNRQAQLLRADALRQTGSLDEAAVIYERLTGKNPMPRALHGLGLIAVSKGQHEAGERLLIQANRLAPIDTRILNDLGYVQMQAGRYGPARTNLAKAFELDAGNAQAGANLALLYLLLGEAGQAERMMERLGMTDAQRAQLREESAGLSGRRAVQ